MVLVTTATLLAELPELGNMDRKKIAALVETWQRKEGGSHGVYAEIPHDPQRHDEGPAALPHVITSLLQPNYKQQLP